MEISQLHRTSASSTGWRENEADVITPSGQQLVIHQSRCLTGYEGLLLQGIHYGPDQGKVLSFNDDLLRSLEGNAFNVHCMAACFVVKKALLAKIWFKVHLKKLASQPTMTGMSSFGLCDFDDLV